MIRAVTWRSWAALLVFAAAVIGSGFWLNGNGTADYHLYKWGLTALTFAPVVLMTVYTAMGNKWWRTDLGTALGWLSGGITWMAWPLAYTFWFLHGSLGPSWVGWCEVSGPAVVALAVLRLCFVFLRYQRDGSDGKGGTR